MTRTERIAEALKNAASTTGSESRWWAAHAKYITDVVPLDGAECYDDEPADAFGGRTHEQARHDERQEDERARLHIRY